MSMPTAPRPPRATRPRSNACDVFFGPRMDRIPVSSNKSQIGHSLGASAAIEAALAIEGMQQGLILPTINHIPDPKFDDIDGRSRPCPAAGP